MANYGPKARRRPMPQRETMDEGMHQEMHPGGPEEMPHDTGAQYTIPADICPGMKPGDEMVLKIVDAKDGNYTVAYAPEEGKEGEGGQSWEDEFREAMSPKEPESAMPGEEAS